MFICIIYIYISCIIYIYIHSHDTIIYYNIYIYGHPPLEPPHTNISCIFTVKILYKKRHVSIHFAQNMKLNSSMKPLQPMAHSAGSLNLTKALYKRLLHGGVLGGVSICIYIYIVFP